MQKNSHIAIMKKVLLIVLLLAALSLRTVGIVRIPPGLSGDESMNGTDAMAMWEWERLPVFFTNNYGREAFFFYLMALCVKIWGANTFSIRLPAILCGMATLVFTYVLVKRLWNERSALLTVGLMSISFWPIFTSRIGLRAISMPPWEALCLYALWRGLHERRWRWWIVTGVALGILTYTYIPGRFFAVVPLLWLSICVVLSTRRPWEGVARRRVWSGLLLACGLALLIFAPFGRYSMQHPELVNQRIKELDNVLQSFWSGNLRPLWQSFINTLGMFTFRGEGDWYYNVSGRPLMDWGTGLCFYAGVLLALSRIREPRYQLLLIWTGVMLAPSIFSIGAPSFLRATGAQTPIYVFPALAIDALWQWLDDHGLRPSAHIAMRQCRHWFGWAVCLGLLLVATRDGQAYFIEWAQHPRTRKIYDAGLAQIGAALDAHLPLPENAQVFVGCDYAADLCRNMVLYQTRYEGPIQWFVGRRALVFPPATTAQRDLFYFFDDALPPETIFLPWAQLADNLTMTRSTDGNLESASLHIPANREWNLPWTPQTALQGQFKNTLTMLGYDLPAQAERAQTVTFVAYWRVPQTFEMDGSAPLWANLTLRDVHGDVWDKRENLLAYAPWDWISGTVVAQTMVFSMPAYIPPVVLYPDFSIEKNGQKLPYHLSTGEVMTSALLSPLQVTGAPVVTPPASHTLLGLADEIALGEVLMIGLARPGERLSTTLHWYTIDTPRADYVVRFQWHQDNCSGPVRHTTIEPLLTTLHPTSHWQPGEPVRSAHDPIIPRELTQGIYGVTLDLIPATQAEDVPASRVACRSVEIGGHARTFTAPDIPYPHLQTLADGVQLLGYSLAPVGEQHPGDALEVTLYWQATAAPTHGYTVFVHLYRPDGQLAGQHDGPPCASECPTFSWVTGEILIDKHTLTIDPSTESGKYRLGVGMYDFITLERLTIPDTENNVILLADIPVRK